MVTLQDIKTYSKQLFKIFSAIIHTVSLDLVPQLEFWIGRRPSRQTLKQGVKLSLIKKDFCRTIFF